ncbi:Uncharacterised protein [Bordetella pertussis]|nr:Uncharacterised protein [Bordetella pertussis]
MAWSPRHCASQLPSGQGSPSAWARSAPRPPRASSEKLVTLQTSASKPCSSRSNCAARMASSSIGPAPSRRTCGVASAARTRCMPRRMPVRVSSPSGMSGWARFSLVTVR